MAGIQDLSDEEFDQLESRQEISSLSDADFEALSNPQPTKKINPYSVASEGVKSDVLGGMQDFNRGLANILGAPVDIANVLLGFAGMGSSKPSMGSESISNMMEGLGMVRPEGKVESRFMRLMGENILPFGGLMGAGAKLSTQAPHMLNEFQKSLVSMYQQRWLAMGAEGTAITAATFGGGIAEDTYPDSRIAGTMGELLGAFSPAAVSLAVKAVPPVLTKIGKTLTGRGAESRASERIRSLSGDIDAAHTSLMQDTELNLTPATASGDEGLIALEKAAINADPELALRIAKLNEGNMVVAKKLLSEGGNPDAVVDYLQSISRRAAAEAQVVISRMGSDVDTVVVARVLRTKVEEALKLARNTERELWAKLPKNGDVNVQPVLARYSEIIKDRTAAADPADIPTFVTALVKVIGKKKPSLTFMKEFRTRVQHEMSVERAKDAPNRNKIRIMGDLESSIFDAVADASPAYADAVAYSRQLNKKFTQGKVGSLLGYERTGELSTSADGTLDFLMSGNKDDIRTGIRQLKEASPQAIPQVKDYIKSTFTLQAIDPNSGALNVSNARRFATQNKHILDEFPDLGIMVRESIRRQRVVDELVGAPIGSEISTFIRDKSVTSLYLNGTPDEAMHRLVTSRNSQGAGAVMRDMVALTNTDPTGRATNGLKVAFKQYLLRHAESDTADVGNISGKRFLNMLDGLDSAAKELFTPTELARIKKIGFELRKIEASRSAKEAKGGIISDAPNKIIQIIGGTYAARMGAMAGQGTSGASLRTASIFTREYNSVLGNLTNDKAEQILLKAMEDKKVMNMLLLEITPENMKKVVQMFSTFIATQTATAAGDLQDAL